MKSTDISPNERDMIQTIRHLSADKAMTVAGIVLDLAGKESQKSTQDDNSNDAMLIGGDQYRQIS